MTRTKFCRTCPAIAVVTVSAAIASTLARGDEQEAREVLAARQAALGNVIVLYHEVKSFMAADELQRVNPSSPEKAIPPDGPVERDADATYVATPLGTMVFPHGSRTYECVFKRARHLAWYERHAIDNGGNSREAQRFVEPQDTVWSYQSGRREYQADGEGAITHPDVLPTDSVIDIALAMRISPAISDTPEAADWLDDSFWNNCEVKTGGDGLIQLTWTAGAVNQIRPIHVWTIDPAQGFAAVRYEMYASVTDGKDLQKSYQIDNDDLRAVSGVMLPFHIRYRHFAYLPQHPAPITTETIELNVASYTLGLLNGTEEEFRITWPDRMPIFDARVNQRFIVKDGPRQLTDDDIAKQYRRGAAALIEEPAKQGARRWRTMALLLINAVAVLALGVLGFRRYRRARPSA